jgi:hypothetical protein
MSELVQETFLASIADNLADTFFTDGATSTKNVMTPTVDDTKEGEQGPTKVIKNDGIKSPEHSISADDLIGDLLERPNEDDLIPSGPTAKVKELKTETSEEDYTFLVEKGILAGFEDDSPIKSKEDLEKLIEGNKKAWVEEATAKVVEEQLDSLPDEVKLIVDYAKNGGQDFKTLFTLMSQNHELRSYDIEKPEDQRAIVRNYYTAQGWTEDEVEEEVINLVESEKLGSQASKLKPKLDKMNADLIAEQTELQEKREAQKKQMSQFMTRNVVETVQKGQLGDIKLSKEEQQDIYNALVKEQYQSLGGKTNRLGALLDKIQYIEPNYELLAKVTMYLSDPVGFEKKLREAVKTEVTAQTVKKIKIDQNKQKIGSNYNPEKDTKKLPKLGAGFINPYE